MFANNAAFDTNGRFIFGPSGQAGLWKIDSIASWAEYSDLASTPLFDDLCPVATCRVLHKKAGAGNDLATFQANLDDKGLQFWTVSYKNLVVMIRRYTGGDSEDTWGYDLNVIAGGPATAGSWGAGWSFQNAIYFAANGGQGVYKVKLDTINIAAKTVELERAADSVSPNLQTHQG